MCYVYLDFGDLSLFGEIARYNENGTLTLVDVNIREWCSLKYKNSWTITESLAKHIRVLSPEGSRLLNSVKIEQLIEILKADCDKNNIARISRKRIEELLSIDKSLVDSQLLAFADLKDKKY